jgi:phosphoesterase RecJ-like protein
MDQLISSLGSARSWVILAHEKPDGDTLGCGSAFFQRGTSMGKKCFWMGPDPFPRIYRFLPFSDSYRTGEDLSHVNMADNPVLIVLDTSNPERSVNGIEEAASLYPVINIDHHGDNSIFGTLNWIDEGASSVGEMVHDLFSKAGWDISSDEAGSLFTAVSTDTGFFRFPATSARTLEISSDLVSRGADPSRIYEEVYENRTLEGLRLWGAGLSRASLHLGGILCSAFLTSEDFRRLNGSREDTENLVNTLLSISGVQIALLFQEEENGCCRVSIRTRNPVDARKIAALWGGGGHNRASGCKIQGSPLDAIRSFISLLEGSDEIGLSGR